MRHPPRLVVLGRQGSGKGTQCDRLAEHFSIRHISTGDLLRDAVREHTEIGRKVAPMLEQGSLVPDGVVLDLVCDQARRADWDRLGFVLDGFPRTVSQAVAFFAVAGHDKQAASHPEIGLDAVIELDVPIETVLERLARRRVCPVCGTTVMVADPAIDVVPCPLGHGPAVRRDDDQPEAIQRRLALYEEETGPLLPWFAKRGLLVRVDGTGDPDAVFARILTALDEVRAPVAEQARRPAR